ncbi:MAG: lysine-sensitive aspartokinase 3 [Pseudomonadota bacterium]|uniref:lysine-sensitive aspartokinase 3 n=1 Tax=Marisediminitalea TaxID=2662254 RepID=UPI000C460B6A|nr:lysine-sensitive aspartokinase 3 [Marisediminitalea aggregata]MBL54404.1 lysine-sensitive aspartokinase 3 [Alteromonadaceae bacterium]MCP3865509.1 lysine-sensitive aspartokinase 3 [Aestuariibacter sp.]MEC8228833.1 lysine-sensitive aspartokinase 3 [Pseudomonadota bacterium]MCP4237968.1 lysine-sensitive aspartokinase 3 [Aestuariibacter sp.]MCP4525920.1 lysine-sensitive aspartokinase 3 [Aestuariibacter sp.]
MSNALTIAKFGGTSVANYAAMQNCAKIVAGNPATRIVVVSAAAGVTNYLVSLAHTPMTQEQINDTVQSIIDIELAILNALKDKANIEPKLNELLDELRSLASHEEILHRNDLKDQLLSMGERMSSLMFSAVLAEQNVQTLNFDVRKVLRTDSEFGEAAPQIDAIAENAQKLLKPEIANAIVVTQGFVGADEEGRTTTLGRGGSDFTAALLAEGLDADVCEIWTDVTGVYTTDPRITPAAHPLPELSFEEAAEMATFGAKVLHPATMEPAVRKDIKVFVGSSKEPEKGGTWIVRDCEHEPSYRAITRRKEQVMVTVKTPKMMYAQGFLQQVFAIIAKHKLSVDLVTTSEISVSFTLDNPANSVAQRLNRETIAELETICDVKVEHGFDLVTVVGNHMQTGKGVSSRIFAAVSDYNLRMICFGANPHNISFLVNESDSTEIVKVLHSELFE